MTYRAMKTVIRLLHGKELARIMISASTPSSIICAEPDYVHIERLFICLREL